MEVNQVVGMAGRRSGEKGEFKEQESSRDKGVGGSPNAVVTEKQMTEDPPF